jgi:hypothetical protein
MGACRSSSENTEKMNLQPILNKTSPWAHMELEFDMLGVPGKLLKYVFSHMLPKQQTTNFWSQGILGVKLVKLVLHGWHL